MAIYSVVKMVASTVDRTVPSLVVRLAVSSAASWEMHWVESMDWPWADL